MNLGEKCKLYIKAGLAYENDQDPIISDNTYDMLANELLRKYDKLPKWFRNKVTTDELHTASAAEFPKKFLGDIFFGLFIPARRPP